MAQTLASTLNQPVNPDFLSGRVQRMESEPNIQKRGQTAFGLEPLARQEQSRLTESAALEEARLQKAQIDEQKRVAEESLGRQERIIEEERGQIGERPERTITAFNPDRAMELATLTALMGVFAGSVTGQAALKAMEGVSEGYRKGQQDLYEREVAAYNDALSEYKSKIDQAEQIIKRRLELETQQRGLGEIEAKKLTPLLNDGLIVQKNRIQDINGQLESIKEAKKLYDQLKVKAFEAGLKPAKAKVIQLQGINAEGKETTFLVDIEDPGFNPSNIFPGAPGVKGVAPPKGSQAKLSATEQKDLNFRKRLKTEMEDLESLFKDDYAGFVTDALGYMSSTAQERAGKSPEMALWWSRFQNVANPERHEIYGATLTKSEQEAWRRGSIGPGNDPKFVRNWFKMRKDMLDNTISLAESGGGEQAFRLDAARKSANDAIQRGASENDVRKRFREIYGEEL